MIPEAKRTAVAQALHAAFGVTEFEAITEMTAGLSSALIFKIVVHGKPYLLRIITRTDAISDPTHWYDCMNQAAAAGIAPHVWYTNYEDRICITDFIETKPFPISEARIKLPALLKRLHALPPFPHRMNYIDRMDGFIPKFQAANILTSEMTDGLFTMHAKITNIYPRNDGNLVSSHNDVKADNILYDGERAWLVDWEAAFLNDRYLDLAIIANFVVTNDEDEKEYLSAYFGNELNEYHHARFFLMRQMLHMYYFTFLMISGTAGGKKADPNMNVPTFRDYHNDLWAGKINVGDHLIQQQYALVHMEQFRANLGLKRLEDSLQIVANHQSPQQNPQNQSL